MPRGNGRNGQPKQETKGLAAYMPKGENGKSATGVAIEIDYRTVDASSMVRAVVAVTRGGGAILFGATQRRDTYAITLMLSGAKNTFYWYATDNAGAEISEWLEGLIWTCDNEQEPLI